MSALEEAHERLHRKNETLANALAKFKERGANIGRAIIHSGEVMAGAAIAGAINGQHVAKPGDKHKGPTIAGMPTDLAIGTGLMIAGALNAVGDEISPHLAAAGLGFLANFAGEWGHARGEARVRDGSWFGHHQGALPAGKVSGEYNPTKMAEDLLNARRQNAGA